MFLNYVQLSEPVANQHQRRKKRKYWPIGNQSLGVHLKITNEQHSKIVIVYTYAQPATDIALTMATET